MVTSSSSVYVALLHHSMRDKNGALVTTAVTNLDIHDIARSSRTYGVKAYFLVNPIEEQQGIVNRIIRHWMGPGGYEYNPDRSEAFSRVKVVSWLGDAIREIEKLEGEMPEVLMTSARKPQGVRMKTWSELREELLQENSKTPRQAPKLLVFGTGWGIADEMLQEASAVLEPILPVRESGYNHLSVRSAVAIALDRILGNV